MEEFLSRTYYGKSLVHDTQAYWDRWKNLAKEFKQSGSPPLEQSYFRMMADPERARRFTEAGYNASLSLAHRLAKRFDFSPYKRWLDFAGGSGCYSIAACERYPNLTTLVLDQENVIPVTKEFIAKHNLNDRIEARVGNFMEPPYPRGFDLISFITPLQAYVPEELRKIFGYTYEALDLGGAILIVDYMLNDEKTGPLDPATMNLQNIKSGQYAGRVNSGAEFETLLTDVGFTQVDRWWLLDHQLGTITAKKPA